MAKTVTLATSAGASGFAAALVVIIVWALSLAGVAVPAEVAAALGTILAGLTHWLAMRDWNPPARKPDATQSPQTTP